MPTNLRTIHANDFIKETAQVIFPLKRVSSACETLRQPQDP